MYKRCLCGVKARIKFFYVTRAIVTSEVVVSGAASKDRTL
jgi:hypothetical protein